ncbi:adenosylcobinamide-phosphate synthase CbiB [Citreicella sp. C3M06]|uniref:adenosylcobinamide-phosphate synthase CbiB n=1 Tax=Citreicella sp. C3M06 TaxID=2841564 RepID=UPI001C0A2161|nr:adenosylcobinamide-phosphate synthase CbiB [Citreicella sp. C3M06]MBU2963743.1 adenosylcobinamide-phosphate synthase CbiB [Citreicella sp. C3M06]
MMFAGAMALALIVDALLGWPDWLFRRLSHPVVWIGALISALDLRWNHGSAARRRVFGGICVGAVLAVVILPAALVQWALPGGLWGGALTALFSWPLVAARSLNDHVVAVARPLASGDLAQARAAVSRIVGRDPMTLGQAGIARAALESLAENASDGVIAPLLWGAVAGLPGIAAYKAINTMDSMIGHRNARYEDFGKPAARLDDLVNLIPARLTGALLALASGRLRLCLRAMMRDAGKHRSPNAGWPEAALAAAVSVRLSGPRVYGGTVADEPWVNDGAPDPDAAAMRRAIALYRRAMLLAALLLGGLALM